MIKKDYGPGVCVICNKEYTKAMHCQKCCSKTCSDIHISNRNKQKWIDKLKAKRALRKDDVSVSNSGNWTDNDEYRIPAPIELKYPHTLLKL